MSRVHHVASLLVVVAICLAGWNSGCGSHNNGGPTDGGDDGTSSGGSGGGGSSGLLGTQADTGMNANGTHICTQDNTICTGSCTGTTTLSGKVFDPAGKNPVFDVAVWVPYTAPSAMPLGLSCNCSELYSGGFVGSYAVTDATGFFKINDLPSPKSGSGGVPLVVQSGKWRYQTQVNVTCGKDNTVTDGNLRLPQGRQGQPGVTFAGDLPHIAISTGGADSLECLLSRVGVVASEYTAGSTTAPTATSPHLHIFQGAPMSSPSMPNAPQSSAQLWDTAAHLGNYDAVLLSCEGAPTTASNPSALFAYGQLGGRVFASHYHYEWFLGAPFPNLGSWYTTYQNQLNNPTYGIVQTTLPNGNPFQEGQAMQQWLQTVGALDSSNELEIYQARHNVDVTYSNFPNGISWMQFDPAKATWPAGVTYDPVTANSTLYFSYDTMAPGTETTCGRFVYSDLHVGGASGDYGESMNDSAPKAYGIVPTGCNANVDLSAQEKALEFMLFELTSCLSPPGRNPQDAGIFTAR